MQWFKESTVVSLVVGPVLDSAGAEYTSAVIGDLSLSKNGGTLTALAAAATLTHIANGYYTLALTTGNTDTLGRADISCNKSTYQMPPRELMVLPATVYDALTTNATTAAGGLGDIQRMAGTALTARDIGASVLLSSGTGTGQVKLSSGYVAPNWGDVGNPTTSLNLSGTTISTSQVAASVTGNVGGNVAGSVGSVTGGINTGAGSITTLDGVYSGLDAGHISIASDTTTLLGRLTSTRAGYLDNLSAGAVALEATAQSILTDTGTTLQGDITAILADTNELQTNQGNWLTATGFSTHSAADVVTAIGTGSTLTAVPWNAAWDAEVQSECADALNAYDPPTDTEMVAAFTQIKGATWATTDTLESIRDRGDAAWTTATGFSTHSAADVVTALGTGSSLTALATAAALTTVDGIVDDILLDTAVIGAAGAGLTAVPWNAAWDAEVQSECADALAAYDPPTKAELDTAESNIRGADSDTLKTLSDQIDGLATAAAPQLLQNTTIATLASQTSFTLTAGSADDDAYNGGIIVVTDQSTATQKAVGSISDYTGSTKTVTLSADPGIFTMAVGDTVDILAAIGSAPTVTQIRTEMDNNSTKLAAILTDTAEIGAAGAGLTALATAANLATVAGYLDTEIAAILTDTGTTLPAQIAALNNLSAAQVNAEVDTALADYDGPTNAEMVARTPSATAIANVEKVYNTDFASNYNAANVGWTTYPGGFYDPGYSSVQAFPAYFANVTINSSGHIGRVTLVDTTTTNTDMRGTDNAALAATALSTAVWTGTKAGYLDAAITSRLAPTTSGRTLTLTAAGNPGVDWANVENPDASVTLSDTDVAFVQNVTTVIDVANLANNSVTASVLAADAIAAIQSGLATPTNITAASGVTLSSGGVDAIWAKTMTELAAVPGVTASVLAGLEWLFALARNKATQTATTQTAFKDDGSTPLATATVSDDGTTFTRGEWS
jgi:phage baseplate assembly protein W